MKKVILSVTVFACVFVFTYLALCYLVPGLRINLEADPVTYLIESVQNAAPFKAAVSAAAGMAAAILVQLVRRILGR